MLKSIIIEDEINAREHLKSLIETFCPTVEIVGEAIDVKSGYECIIKHQPELVFLDIEMPDGTGFDILKKIGRINFNIIFTTAYSDYAIEAFKFSAIHYLLKPIDTTELQDAVAKAEKEIGLQNLESRFTNLLNNLEVNSAQYKRVVLTTNSKIHIINADEIIMCQSDKNYTDFFLVDGSELTVSKSIKEYDEMLASSGFFRPHRQFLINLKHIREFDKTGPKMIILTNGHKAPVSVRRRDDLISLIQRL